MKTPTPRLAITGRVQGAAQFLEGRARMLSLLDQAKSQQSGKKVKVDHGKVAEASFRAWLASFLPARYGVTSGYVLSQGLPFDSLLPHYDVIIYDKLESPVLWEEQNLDSNVQGLARAIPCEFIKGIIEVKSRFSARTVREAIKHLKNLEPFLEKIDPPEERWKLYLPRGFFSMMVFFEMDKSDALSIAPLNSLARTFLSRSFEGGLVLRGNTHDRDFTGRIEVGDWNGDYIKTISRIQWDTRTLLNGGLCLSECLNGYSDTWRASLSWGESNFARAAFDLLALLNGKYERGMISSWHAVASPASPIKVPEKTDVV